MSNSSGQKGSNMNGVWTQDGQILCEQCISIGFGMKQSLYLNDEAQLVCDHCHRLFDGPEDLAMEQQLVYALRQTGYLHTNMSQTGGMCHAVEATLVDKSYLNVYMIFTWQTDHFDGEIFAWDGLLIAATAHNTIDDVIQYLDKLKNSSQDPTINELMDSSDKLPGGVAE